MDFTIWQWLVLIQHELLLLAAVFFLIGAIDDLCVDFAWIWLKLSGRSKTLRLSEELRSDEDIEGWAAVFIPTWQERHVIGATINHALSVWPSKRLRLYVGCYRNDPETIAAASNAAKSDMRLRLVIHDTKGPSTKADCLNRLYRALELDEDRTGQRAKFVMLHDAEDMVDPAALKLMSNAIETADIVQIPVLPLPQRHSAWIGSHYCEEFAETNYLVIRKSNPIAIKSIGAFSQSSKILNRLTNPIHKKIRYLRISPLQAAG